MWRRTACLVALCLAHDTALTSYGQDRPLTPLSGQCPCLRFELVMGRITAIHLNTSQVKLARGTEAESDFRETLQVSSDGPVPLVRYECETPGQRVNIEITNSTRVSIHKESRRDAADQLVLDQSASGPVKVFVGGKTQPKYTAPTFWHLLLAERRFCEQEVIPLLQLLRPGWNLTEAAEQLEDALYRAAQSGQVVNRTRLAELVNDLGHPQFQRRQAADRELRALGPAVLPFFASLNATSISKEQRNRMRQIRESMASASVDSPDRVAQWLLDDEQIWVTLMTHPDGAKRHLAAMRLTEIHPEAANFDPYGDETYRQQQLAQLRLVLSRE